LFRIVAAILFACIALVKVIVYDAVCSILSANDFGEQNSSGFLNLHLESLSAAV
jgi:hypothetical protein